MYNDRAAENVGSVAAGYAIARIGDLHGDGYSDLFRDSSSGSLTSFQISDGHATQLLVGNLHDSYLSETAAERADNRIEPA